MFIHNHYGSLNVRRIFEGFLHMNPIVAESTAEIPPKIAKNWSFYSVSKSKPSFVEGGGV